MITYPGHCIPTWRLSSLISRDWNCNKNLPSSLTAPKTSFFSFFSCWILTNFHRKVLTLGGGLITKKHIFFHFQIQIRSKLTNLPTLFNTYLPMPKYTYQSSERTMFFPHLESWNLIAWDLWLVKGITYPMQLCKYSDWLFI